VFCYKSNGEKEKERERERERERVAPTRDSANRGTANRRINTPSSNCGVTSVGSDHERERRRLHFALSLPAALSLFLSKRVDMHGATTTILQHETQESIIILLLTCQFKIYRVHLAIVHFPSQLQISDVNREFILP